MLTAQLPVRLNIDGTEGNHVPQVARKHFLAVITSSISAKKDDSNSFKGFQFNFSYSCDVWMSVG